MVPAGSWINTYGQKSNVVTHLLTRKGVNSGLVAFNPIRRWDSLCANMRCTRFLSSILSADGADQTRNQMSWRAGFLWFNFSGQQGYLSTRSSQMLSQHHGKIFLTITDALLKIMVHGKTFFASFTQENTTEWQTVEWLLRGFLMQIIRAKPVLLTP